MLQPLSVIVVAAGVMQWVYRLTITHTTGDRLRSTVRVGLELETNSAVLEFSLSKF